MNEKIKETIFAAIDEVNEQRPKDKQIEKTIETPLAEPSGQLDSLGIINLIVATEQKIEEELGATITLADEKAMFHDNNPFRTVGTLAEYISALVEEKAIG